MRKLPALVAASVLAASLAACTSSGPASIDGCTPVGGPGRASELVTVSGELGAEPQIDFPTPLVSSELERSTIIAGEGAPIAPGQQVRYDITILLGSDTTLLAASGYDGETVARGAAGAAGTISIGLSCARVGERFVMTGPALQVIGSDGVEATGITEDATVVVLYDVLDAYLAKADGLNQLLPDGMPTVVTAVDGRPGLTLPGGPPPAEIRVAAVKLGFGATVEEGDRVVLHYTVFNWPDVGTQVGQLESTWENGVARSIIASPEYLAEGILSAIIGFPVGSQVMSVVPPNEETGEAARVVVVDLLGIEAG